MKRDYLEKILLLLFSDFSLFSPQNHYIEREFCISSQRWESCVAPLECVGNAELVGIFPSLCQAFPVMTIHFFAFPSPYADTLMRGILAEEYMYADWCSGFLCLHWLRKLVSFNIEVATTEGHCFFVSKNEKSFLGIVAKKKWMYHDRSP